MKGSNEQTWWKWREARRLIISWKTILKPKVILYWVWFSGWNNRHLREETLASLSPYRCCPNYRGERSTRAALLERITELWYGGGRRITRSVWKFFQLLLLFFWLSKRVNLSLFNVGKQWVRHCCCMPSCSDASHNVTLLDLMSISCCSLVMYYSELNLFSITVCDSLMVLCM